MHPIQHNLQICSSGGDGEANTDPLLIGVDRAIGIGTCVLQTARRGVVVGFGASLAMMALVR